MGSIEESEYTLQRSNFSKYNLRREIIKYFKKSKT